jgi:hypothetical protein
VLETFSSQYPAIVQRFGKMAHCAAGSDFKPPQTRKNPSKRTDKRREEEPRKEIQSQEVPTTVICLRRVKQIPVATLRKHHRFSYTRGRVSLLLTDENVKVRAWGQSLNSE